MTAHEAGLLDAVLLDTCAVIWLAEGLELSEQARAVIAQAGGAGGIVVSAVSAWEIGLLARPKKSGALRFLPDPQSWFRRFAESPGVRELPLTGDVAIEASSLPGDLLKLWRSPDLNIRTLVRPALFVPESKGLQALEREFRSTRNHMAIVIDEFGRIAGLVTFEDVIEQIVGEIEDEFDIHEDEGDIFGLPDHSYRVSGETPVERVAEAFEVTLRSSDPDEVFDTIGGLIAHELGRVPRKGEVLLLGGLRFVVLHTKGGLVRWFKVTPAAADESATNS